VHFIPALAALKPEGATTTPNTRAMIITVDRVLFFKGQPVSVNADKICGAAFSYNSRSVIPSDT
jgi:hypothetical protein